MPVLEQIELFALIHKCFGWMSRSNPIYRGEVHGHLTQHAVFLRDRQPRVGRRHGLQSSVHITSMADAANDHELQGIVHVV